MSSRPEKEKKSKSDGGADRHGGRARSSAGKGKGGGGGGGGDGGGVVDAKKEKKAAAAKARRAKVGKIEEKGVEKRTSLEVTYAMKSTLTRDILMAQLTAAGLVCRAVMEDSIEVEDASALYRDAGVAYDKADKGAAALARIAAESHFFGPEIVHTRTRKVKPFSREKYYRIERHREGPLAGLCCYYGGYTGSVPGHALAGFFDDEVQTDGCPMSTALWRAIKRFQAESNHMIVTRYVNERKSMPAHSDKYDNLVDNGFIFDLSLGATRHLVFRRTDRDGDEKGHGGDASQKVKAAAVKPEGKIAHTVELRSGSLFVLGPVDNSKHTHEVPECDEPCGPRASVIFRAVKTFKTEAGMRAIRKDHEATQYEHRAAAAGIVTKKRAAVLAKRAADKEARRVARDAKKPAAAADMEGKEEKKKTKLIAKKTAVTKRKTKPFAIVNEVDASGGGGRGRRAKESDCCQSSSSSSSSSSAPKTPVKVRGVKRAEAVANEKIGGDRGGGSAQESDEQSAKKRKRARTRESS